MSLPTLPVQPDPLDPRTPAILVWRNENIHSYVLVWRKRTNEFSVSTHATTSSYPNLTVWTPNCDSIGLRGEWNPIKFREAPVYLRRIMLGNSHRLIKDLAQNSRGRMVPLPADDRADFPYRGRRLMYGWSFLRTKRHYASWSVPIREALQVYSDGTWREQTRAKAELVTFANGTVRYDVQGRFVEAVNDAFSAAGHDEPLTVASCGHVEDTDDTQNDYNGDSYCQNCAEDLREIDGEYYNENDCYYWESDGEYHTCEEPEEDEDDDDDSDNDEPYSGHIQGWSTTANANRLAHTELAKCTPHTDFTLGVELEAECESSRDFSEAVAECHEYFNADYRYAMFKRDGSLSDRGFEIVTAARLLPDHLKMFGEWTPHETMRSWKPGNCGTHVHIDSRAFSALTLGKFLMFINADHNVPLVKAIAGRHPRDDAKAQSYCAQLGQEVLGDPSKALKSDNTSRYRMVNISNLSYQEQTRLNVSVQRDSKGDYSTIELRIFRASLKKERHLAQIEFAHAAVIFCRSASWHNLTGAHFKEWLAGKRGEYKNLARWFGVTKVNTDTRKAAPVVVRELEAECA